ncbi:MAG: hypothetical protein JW863_19615 [Chitinispirillaceae bacterium]|nr:hypothetical protein [Chitinispirillaceae bacterium]
MKRIVLLMVMFAIPFSMSAQSDTNGAELPAPLPAPLPLQTEQAAVPESANSNTESSDPEYTIGVLQDKLDGFTRMNVAGGTMLTAGGIVTPLAIIGLVSGISMLIDENESGVVPYLLGGIGIAFGPPMIAAGAVLRNIGSKKQMEYERRLQLQLSMNGVRLSYLF